MKRALGSLILAATLFSPALFAQEASQQFTPQEESFEVQTDNSQYEYDSNFDWDRGHDRDRDRGRGRDRDRDRWPGRGVICRAYDNGWEEHRGGHSSCEACMQDHHGSCTESCSATQYECVAVGYDRRGGMRRIPARGFDRWSAEREALNNCSRRLDNCRIESCDQRTEEVSRRACR